MLSRRRFLAISAALTAAPGHAAAPHTHVETALAMGAQVTLRLQHPDAPRLAALALAEIRRLEGIFSLYLPDSALVRLNRDGVLADPPFELLDCLSLAGAVHAASGGLFDPTVQPLWAAHAAATLRGRGLGPDDRALALSLAGWGDVRLAPDRISLRKGQALTLNGIAQGHVADRVAALLARHGLTRALIDSGEMLAMPDGDWSVTLPTGASLGLQGRALATSAPLGMTFGGDGVTGHILDPRSGRPARSPWRAITVSAASAALADALSTAACLSDTPATLCAAFGGARLEVALPA